MSLLPFNQKQKLDSFIEFQNHVLQCQISNTKFFIGRLSGNESSLVGKILSGQNISEYLLKNMLFVAGIKFKDKNDIKKYVIMYNNSVKESTLLAVWDGEMYRQAESYYSFINKLYPNIKQICAHSLEPYYFMNDNDYKYDKMFKSKKILIISSHKATIEKQIKHVNSIFDKKLFDESTELKVYKPAQQNAGNSDDKSWCFHYDQMKTELKTIKENEFNFDVAFVSAGGFGMILCEYIYSELNSSVIYIGGALQLLFGINGGRWANNGFIKKSQNEYWTNVLEEDKPKSPSLCENSSYW
tara:strand:+ start:1094 stop:1990 length:897 start_codon:yes stop_codon:yes gene_type:complete